MVVGLIKFVQLSGNTVYLSLGNRFVLFFYQYIYFDFFFTGRQWFAASYFWFFFHSTNIRELIITKKNKFYFHKYLFVSFLCFNIAL